MTLGKKTASLGIGILLLVGIASSGIFDLNRSLVAQTAPGPTMLDPTLAVRTAASDLVTPITMAFLGPRDMLVLEKNTGKVQRVVNGLLHSTALDLSVNFASERGLLGIAMHPNFPSITRSNCSGRAAPAVFRTAIPSSPRTGSAPRCRPSAVDRLPADVKRFAHRVRGLDLRVLWLRRTSLRRPRCVHVNRAVLAE